MRDHNFTCWLQEEAAAASCALLTIYEERDRLQYIEAPQLEREYMDKVGSFEETVIREEIECEVLQKKQKMIQAAINRREPIDEAAIDAELAGYRQELMEEAAGPAAPDDYPQLSLENQNLLQDMYREIVDRFHPEMHPELTEVHRQLFLKAQEAYRRRDLDALRLIREMLFSTQEGDMSLKIMLEMLPGVVQAGVSTEEEQEHTTDYSLAAEIYSSFKAFEKDASIQEEGIRYRRRAEDVMAEIEMIRSGFPFNAAEMLADPEKLEAYKEKLNQRLHAATAEREQRTRTIRAMIESVESNE